MERSRIVPPGRSSCAVCKRYGDAASEYEWFCPILRDTICETHCTEVQMQSYKATRQAIAAMLQLGGDVDDLLSKCAKCPFGSPLLLGTEQR